MAARKYILNSDFLGEQELVDDPVGWDNIDHELVRDNVLVGVTRKHTAELRFHNDGLDYVEALYKAKGTEASLQVTVLRQQDFVDALEVEFRGVAKLNPYALEFEGEKPFVKLTFEDSDFHNKFLTRKDMEINIGLQESIDGVALGSVPIEKIQIRQRIIIEKSLFSLSVGNEAYSYPSAVSDSIVSANGHVIPMAMTEGDSDNVGTPADYIVDPTVSPSGIVYDFINQPAVVRIQYHIAVDIALAAPDPGAIVIRKFTNSADLSVFTDTVLQVVAVGSNSYNFSGVSEFTLNANEAVTIMADLPVPTLSTYLATYSIVDITVDVTKQFADDIITDCHYRHEYLKRLCQIITDQIDCFKSSVFGRVDIGYPADGKYSNNAVMSGKQIRGFDSPPKIKLSDSLQSIRAIWNVGCGIEKIDRLWKVVVEEIPYFFRGDISVTLHNCSEIRREVAPEFTFSDVEVGYEDAEYEEANGLEEYNNKSRYATHIKTVKNTLSLISTERADCYGGEYARRKHKTIAASEDTRYDESVFTYMVDEIDGTLVTQRDGNYSSVQNILSPETAGNLDITPKRNLLRNGDWLQGCLNKYPDEKVKFISADKETDLITTRTGESALTDQADVNNSDLLSSLWVNEKIFIRAPISANDMQKVEAKPYSLIKWSPTSREQTKQYFYGWLLNIKGGNEEGIGTAILLRANLLSDRLNLIDPEGIFTGDEGTPLPPQDTEDIGLQVILKGALEN